MTARDRALSVALWGLYFWLLKDAFLLAHDLAVWEWLRLSGTKTYSPVSEVAQGTLDTLSLYAIVIAANAALFVLWARYNRWRFRGRERRKTAPLVSAAELGSRYGFSGADVETWQGARRMVMRHDRKGHLLEVAHDGAGDERKSA